MAWPCGIGPGLSAIRAAATRHHFQTFDFLAHGFIQDDVGQEDQPVRAGVGVVSSLASLGRNTLDSLVSTVSTFLWAGLRGAPTPAGPSLYATSSF